jgi:hypothetical protein
MPAPEQYPPRETHTAALPDQPVCRVVIIIRFKPTAERRSQPATHTVALPIKQLVYLSIPSFASSPYLAHLHMIGISIKVGSYQLFRTVLYVYFTVFFLLPQRLFTIAAVGIDFIIA